MGKVIAFANHKGGVGKTTSVVNIGAGLSNLGKKVLLIDIDPQANLSQSLGFAQSEMNIYGALKGEYGLTATYATYKGIDVVVSTLNLSGAELELAGVVGREYILKELIDPVKNNYDYVLIDCPPSLGLLTINALTASDEVMIPAQSEFLALNGLSKVTEVIGMINKRLNKGLKIGGVFVTQYDGRKILNRDIYSTLKDNFDGYVFKAKIRDNVALAEAPSQGIDIFSYNSKSYGAVDYLSLCMEILQRM